MRLSREDGELRLTFGPDAFAHPICEWSQLVGHWNWRDYHAIKVHLMLDGALPGWELEVILLGLGFRFRRNHPWERSATGRQVEAALAEIQDAGYAPPRRIGVARLREILEGEEVGTDYEIGGASSHLRLRDPATGRTAVKIDLQDGTVVRIPEEG